MMENPQILNFKEHRRANRLPWERPVRITQPVQTAGQAVNASAVGLLVRVGHDIIFSKGDLVAIEIPRADGAATTTRAGRIARVEESGEEMLVGVELV